MQIVLALVLLTSVASAEEPVAARRPPCIPNGAVWFQIDVTDTRPDARPATAKLFANGGTTVARGKEASTMRCLSRDELDAATKLLKRSPWKATNPRFTCDKRAPVTVVIRVFGRRVFTDDGCSPDRLDKASAEALIYLKKVMPPVIPDRCSYDPGAPSCIE